MVRVRGYRRWNGTYVRGHYRSAPATPDFGRCLLGCGIVVFWLLISATLGAAVADALGIDASTFFTVLFAFAPVLAGLAWFGRESKTPAPPEGPRAGPSDPQS